MDAAIDEEMDDEPSMMSEEVQKFDQEAEFSQ